MNAHLELVLCAPELAVLSVHPRSSVAKIPLSCRSLLMATSLWVPSMPWSEISATIAFSVRWAIRRPSNSSDSR